MIIIGSVSVDILTKDIVPHLTFVTHFPFPHRLHRFKLQSFGAEFVFDGVHCRIGQFWASQQPFGWYLEKYKSVDDVMRSPCGCPNKVDAIFIGTLEIDGIDGLRQVKSDH